MEKFKQGLKLNRVFLVAYIGITIALLANAYLHKTKDPINTYTKYEICKIGFSSSYIIFDKDTNYVINADELIDNIQKCEIGE